LKIRLLVFDVKHYFLDIEKTTVIFCVQKINFEFKLKSKLLFTLDKKGTKGSEDDAKKDGDTKAEPPKKSGDEDAKSDDGKF
jgi:hypothetical protein